MIKPYKNKNEKTELPPITKELVNKYDDTIHQINFTSDKYKILENIYDFLNTYNSFVDTFSVCHKGCSACCKNKVQITEIEAEYIQNNTDHKITNNSYFNKNWDCPFLIDNSCSIYNVRPFSCRTLHTLDDPKYCETSEEHQLYGAHLGKGVPMYERMASIIKTISPDIKDIRYFFKKGA